MSSYKVGDLSKVFESSPGLTKSPSSKNEGKKNKKHLFGAAKRIQDRSGNQDSSKDQDIEKANKMKAKIEKEKEKQKLKQKDSPCSETKAESSPSTQEQKSNKKKRKQESMEAITDTKSDDTPATPKVNKKKNKKSKLDSSLETKGVDSPSTPGLKPKEQKKKRKKEKEDANSKSDPDNPTGFDPKGIVHESLLGKGQKRRLDDDNEDENKGDKSVKKKKAKTEEELDKPKKKRLRTKPSMYSEENKRTIFVGNLSLEMTDKEVLKMFKEFGEIESVRRRCIPVKDPDQLKRVSAIKKEFHPERHNSICYVKFKTEEAAKKSLVKNGKVVKDLHIRVDLVHGEITKDTKRTVFVGNLPFDVEEEAVWAHFEDCGDIENVRIIRDRQTCLGKGIGYVQFKDAACVSLALKLNGSKFQDKALRVSVCEYKNDGKKKKLKAGKPKIPFSKKNKAKAKDGDSSGGFQGEKAKRPKRKRTKSNVKSSVVFPANKPPNTVNKTFENKSFGGYSQGGPAQNKHIKFGDSGSVNKTFSGKDTGFKGRQGGLPMQNKTFSTGNISRGKPAFNATATTPKGKHTVFD